MADVQIRFSTTGAEQAAQSFAQVGQSSQRFAQTTSASVTQARVATQSFSFVLLDISRIARATGGAAGKDFANSLDGAVIALSSARGAVAAFRGVLVSQKLITEALTAANLALAASWGLGLLAVAAIVAIVVILVKHHREAAHAAEEQKTAIDGITASARLAALHFAILNDRLQDSILLQHMTAGETQGLTLSTQGLLGPSVALHQTFRDLAKEQKEDQDAVEQLSHAFDELGKAELEQVVIPRMRDLASGMQHMVLDARDAARVARELQEFQIQLDLAANASKDTAENLHGVVLEARDVGRVAKETGTDLNRVFTEAEIRAIDFANKVKHTGEVLQTSVQTGLTGILTGTSTFADLWTQIWDQAVAKIIEKIGLVKIAVSAISAVLGFFGIFLQRGGSFIATRPTPLMVGEAGAERVTVSPLAGSPAAGGSGLTVNFNAPQFWDEYTFNNFARRVGRILVSGPVGRVG